jgi:hypothetical protein
MHGSELDAAAMDADLHLATHSEGDAQRDEGSGHGEESATTRLIE